MWRFLREEWYFTGICSLVFIAFCVLGVSGCNTEYSEKEESEVVPSRLEFVGEPLDNGRRHSIRVIRDKETGQEYLWATMPDGTAICPAVMKEER